MRTTKPISTISFNTIGFLRLKLEELTKAKRISFWAFMKHQPEDDEGGKKVHCHVYVLPSRMLQTDDLREELKEPDPEKPSSPLGCMPFENSKFDDWYLYALHDIPYLASKNQSRKFHYRHDEFQTSDEDYLLYLARRIDRSQLMPYADMLDALKHGFTFEEYFSRGTIPLPQLGLWEKAWKLLSATSVYRNGKKAHLVPTDDKKFVDPDTGEVFETIKAFEDKQQAISEGFSDVTETPFDEVTA